LKKLLGLRADVERAVEKVIGKARLPRQLLNRKHPARKRHPVYHPPECLQSEGEPETAAAKSTEATASALDFETCNGADLGTVDFGAAFARAFDDDGETWGGSAADVFMGSGSVCE